MSPVTTSGSATFAELSAIPQEDRFHEVVNGELVRKASPSGRHGLAQASLSEHTGPYRRRPGGRSPGGWWIVSEVEVELEPHEVYRPDLSGWRRERLAELPTTTPILVRPDWVCEILSPSKPQRDRIEKFQVHQRHGVPHYWLVDPDAETLVVHRWTSEGYLVVVAARRGDRVWPEPFEAIELCVGALFGDDPDEPIVTPAR